MKHVFASLLTTALLGLAGLAPAQTTPQYTFSQDIAPLVYQHCTSCHRTGEVAPFPLTTYAEVASHAQTIKYVTGTRYMPPWKPDPRYRHFLDENTLSDAEIAKIAAWVDNGAPQGNPAATPPVPTYPSGSQLGTPDLVIPMAHAFTHQGNGQDMYRVFVLPVNLPADRDISAIEFRPGNKSIVHHCIIALDTTQQGPNLDAADPGYGYTSFGGFGFTPLEGVYGAWVPGMHHRFYPSGMGKKLYRRASLLVQIHYGPNFVTQRDSSVVNVFFARQPVTRNVQTLPVISPYSLTNGPFVIPANQTKTFHAEYTVPIDVTLMSLAPHAHLLSKSWKVAVLKPNGDTIRLIKIGDWDFRWQGIFRFPNLLKVPAGSRLVADAMYDNTAQNPRNPNSPPQTVTWGEGTRDEMILTYFELLPYRTGDENIVLSTMPGLATTPGTVQMAIYPNPAGAATTVSFQQERPGPVSVSILDATGRLVRSVVRDKAYPAGPQQLPLPLADLGAGIYLIRLDSEQGTRTEKLVVNK